MTTDTGNPAGTDPGLLPNELGMLAWGLLFVSGFGWLSFAISMNNSSRWTLGSGLFLALAVLATVFAGVFTVLSGVKYAEVRLRSSLSLPPSTQNPS